MLDLGQSVRKCAATLSRCRLDGATDAEFIGLYAGLLYASDNFEGAQKVWDEANGQNFSYEERIKKQHEPDGSRMRFRGVVKPVKARYLFIQPIEGFDIISSTLVVNGLALKKHDKVEYTLSFSAKSPFAEHLQLVS